MSLRDAAVEVLDEYDKWREDANDGEFALYNEDGIHTALLNLRRAVPPAPVPREQREPARPKSRIRIDVPQDHLEDGHLIVTTLLESCREELAPTMGWTDDVSFYFVLTAVLSDWLQSGKQLEQA